MKLSSLTIMNQVIAVTAEKENRLAAAADTVIDPKKQDCTYPFKQMCAAGIATLLYDRLVYLSGRALSYP